MIELLTVLLMLVATACIVFGGLMCNGVMGELDVSGKLPRAGVRGSRDEGSKVCFRMSTVPDSMYAK